jgi:dienelactone hydrolase
MLSRSRVQDVGFLLDHLLDGRSPDPAIPDPDRIGIVGHSIGGWTALAVPETDARVRAVVALAPGGASNPKPGIIPATLTFAWSRPVATLYLVAEQDVCLPLAGCTNFSIAPPDRSKW